MSINPEHGHGPYFCLCADRSADQVCENDDGLCVHERETMWTECTECFFFFIVLFTALCVSQY